MLGKVIVSRGSQMTKIGFGPMPEESKAVLMKPANQVASRTLLFPNQFAAACPALNKIVAGWRDIWPVSILSAIQERIYTLQRLACISDLVPRLAQVDSSFLITIQAFCDNSRMLICRVVLNVVVAWMCWK